MQLAQELELTQQMIASYEVGRRRVPVSLLPAISRYDAEHSEGEERWLILGVSENGVLLVVSHTFQELSEQEARVRLISAREATAQERRQYEGG